VARVYIELFRGTPVLLQLYVIYFGLGPYYALGPVTAAIVTLGLNYAAYEAEVYRGALLAIPRGQAEAAKALGLSPARACATSSCPQALRLALPPMTNDFVALLKDSSLVSVITVIELTKQMTISAAELQGWLMPGLACAGVLPGAQRCRCRSWPADWRGGSRVISVRTLCKRHGDRAVLAELSAEVTAGEMVAIVGPSGGGKSTLLRCLNHLEPFDAGRSTSPGSRWPRAARRRAGDLAPAAHQGRDGVSAVAPVPAPDRAGQRHPGAAGGARGDRRRAGDRGRELLARVGLGERGDAYPHELSGGQQQRVAIARALAQAPEVLLFDEPTSALDPEMTDEVIAVMRDLAAGGMTMLVVTHEMRLATDLATRVWVIDRGTIVEDGTPAAVIAAPKSAVARDYLGRRSR
jgi:ABC-type polar amino acid transport system ATPase subunit